MVVFCLYFIYFILHITNTCYSNSLETGILTFRTAHVLIKKLQFKNSFWDLIA